MAEDESERFHDAMLELTDEQRQAIRLKYLHNSTLPEIDAVPFTLKIWPHP